MHPAMAEQWQSISNYERYLVSDQGRVMNSKTGRILKPCIASNTYLHVRLCKDGTPRAFLVTGIPRSGASNVRISPDEAAGSSPC